MAYITPKNLTATLIKKQVIRVEKLIGERNKFKTITFNKQKLFNERKRFEEKEKKLEIKPIGKEKLISGKISTPKLGFLDSIKNFLFTILLGAFTIKMLPHLPKLKGVLIGAIKFNEFILSFSGFILNSLVTFIDKVYQIVDFGKQQAKMFGGDKGLQEYNKTLDLATKVMNSMFIAGMLFSDLVESDSRGSATQEVVDVVKDRVVQQAGQRAAQQAAIRGAAQLSTRAAAGVVASVGLISSALGEGMFQLRKFTTKVEKDAYAGLAEAQKDPNPFMRFLKVGFYNTVAIPGMRFYNFLLTSVGSLLDIIGAPFRYAIELINFGIMSLTGDSDGIKKQRENLGKFDARIREQLRQVVNTLSFGMLAKQQGSFGSLFGDQAVKSMGYASGGSVSRGGEYRQGIARTIGKKVKARRIVEVPTSPLQPGVDVNGSIPYKNSDISKIDAFYPNPSDPGTVNPHAYLKDSYDISSSTKFFHPLFEISIKTLFGDKPSEGDFKSVGVGIDNFFNDILSTTKVPGKDVSVSDEVGSFNISNWVSSQIKDSMKGSINSILSDLMDQLTLKRGLSDSTKVSPSAQKGPTVEDNPLSQFGGQAQFVIGDSIAHGFAGRTGNGSDTDDSKVGRSPSDVLKILKSKGDVLKGMLVDLSTGIANSPGDFASVEEQLSYLKSMGARVRVLGLANSFSERNGNLNQKLEQIAKKYGFYFYGGYKGSADGVHGTATDYAELKSKVKRDTSEDLSRITGKGSAIYLHWTAGSYGGVSGNYHTTITGDGKINRTTPYDKFNVGHTHRRNSNAVGLSVAAMGGSPDPWSIPVKPIQYQKMAEEAARIAKAWGWSASDINIKNVMTHAEAGANKDGSNRHENYGPKAWGGTGERWDLFNLYKNDSPGSGGDKIRSMIKGMMFEGGYISQTGYYLTHPGEYIVDADSVKLFGINFYDLINKTETVSQRKKASESLISILSQYTEDGFPETDDDYTYYASENSTLTIVPPIELPVKTSSIDSQEVSYEDPSMDVLFM